jgi:phytoene dehydrogenase-like protein
VTVLEKLDAPGGRAYVHRQDGFTFDAGPTIITAPFLLEELWALCGSRWPTTCDLRPMDPFYRIRFDDGSWFDYSGDLDRACAPRWRASARRRGRLRALRGRGRHLLPLGFEELGPSPSTPSATCWRRARPDEDARLAQHARHGGQPPARPAAAHRDELPPAADRRQPVLGDQRLQPDQHAGAPLRRALGDGRHRHVVRGLVGCSKAWAANCA